MKDIAEMIITTTLILAIFILIALKSHARIEIGNGDSIKVYELKLGE